jgi:hypothetical protein
MSIILLSIALIASVEIKPLRSIPFILTGALSLLGTIATSFQLCKEFKHLGWQIIHQQRELILFDLLLIILLCLNIVFFFRL